LFLVFFLASCGALAPKGPIKDPTYRAAEAAYLSQDYGSAVRGYSNFIEKNPFGAGIPDAFYWRGMAYLELKDYSRAAADLQKAVDSASDETLRAQALFHLGQAAGLRGDFATAETAYKRVLKRYAASFPQDEVLYLLGLSCLRQGRWDEANDYFRTLVRNFPRSARRALAEEKLANKDRFFSVQVGAFTSWQGAEAKQRELRASGMDSFIRTVVRRGSTYYCVRTGRFRSWSAAGEYANRVIAAGFSDAVRVP
jgi:TolA-binding protein